MVAAASRPELTPIAHAAPNDRPSKAPLARACSPKKAIAGRLADRVMFGCDFPVLRYEKVMADWNAEGYSREVLEKVLYRNAETYFGANQGGNR